MARPRKTADDTFYDVFADQTPEEQAIMLRTLETIHRQSKRIARRSGSSEPDPTSEPAAAPE